MPSNFNSWSSWAAVLLRYEWRRSFLWEYRTDIRKMRGKGRQLTRLSRSDHSQEYCRISAMRHLIGVPEGSVFVVEDCSLRLSCSPDVIELGVTVSMRYYTMFSYNLTYLEKQRRMLNVACVEHCSVAAGFGLTFSRLSARLSRHASNVPRPRHPRWRWRPHNVRLPCFLPTR